MARPLTAMLALSRAAAFLGPSPHKKPTVATPMLAEREEKWEPPEFEENRIKARKRQERFSPLDKAGAARRLMLDAQRQMKERQRQRPAYLPLKPEASLENATAGQWFSGVVRNLKPHGAWVSIGAEVDGFVHCRDMSDTDFVSDSREVLRLGDGIEGCVKGADAAKRVLSLSMLQVEPVDESRPISQWTSGRGRRRTRVTPHAAFVDVGARVPAYLHVADIGSCRARRRRARRARSRRRGHRLLGRAVDVVATGCGRRSCRQARARRSRLIRRGATPLDEEDDAEGASRLIEEVFMFRLTTTVHNIPMLDAPPRTPRRRGPLPVVLSRDLLSRTRSDGGRGPRDTQATGGTRRGRSGSPPPRLPRTARTRRRRALSLFQPRRHVAPSRPPQPSVTPAPFLLYREGRSPCAKALSYAHVEYSTTTRASRSSGASRRALLRPRRALDRSAREVLDHHVSLYVTQNARRSQRVGTSLLRPRPARFVERASAQGAAQGRPGQAQPRAPCCRRRPAAATPGSRRRVHASHARPVARRGDPAGR